MHTCVHTHIQVHTPLSSPSLAGLALTDSSLWHGGGKTVSPILMDVTDYSHADDEMFSHLFIGHTVIEHILHDRRCGGKNE